jgi:hypothetical protein
MRALSLLLPFLLSIMFWSCVDSKDSVTGSDTDLVPVQVNLVMGFGQKEVRLKVDGKQFYQAYPSGTSSYAGPQATMNTYLERDSRQLAVWWRNTGGGTAKEDSIPLVLKNVTQYYLYLIITPADTLQVEAQEWPINYAKPAGRNSNLPR